MKTNDLGSTKQIQLCVPPGSNYHFGITNSLKNIEQFLNFNEEIVKIVIGIDGLPLTKSSNSAFWPILGYIRHPSSKPYVFLIGLYWGNQKAIESNIYLSKLVNELKDLYENGFVSSFGNKIVIVDAICCDAPAKS